MRTNTNISSMSAIRSLGNTSKALARALERLASGRRITRAGDDAAGLAIGTGLESQVRGLARVAQNINEAFASLQVAEGGLQSQAELLHRMRELAVQASNGTLSSTDRSYLNNEVQKLALEFARLSEQTDFNGSKILQGALENVSIQVGTQKENTIDLSINNTKTNDIFDYLKDSETV